MSESTRPTAPMTIRTTPTACRSTPETVAVTAHLRIAPAAMRTRLVLMPMRPSVSLAGAPRVRADETSSGASLRGLTCAPRVHAESLEALGMGRNPGLHRLRGPARHAPDALRGDVELAVPERLVRPDAAVRVPGRDAGGEARLDPGLARSRLVAQAQTEEVVADRRQLVQRMRLLAGEIEGLVLVPGADEYAGRDRRGVLARDQCDPAVSARAAAHAVRIEPERQIIEEEVHPQERVRQAAREDHLLRRRVRVAVREGRCRRGLH